MIGFAWSSPRPCASWMPLTTDELIISAMTIFCAVIFLLAIMGASRAPDDKDN